MKEKMERITNMLLEKTESRMRKETTLSYKTLKMISLSEKLFATVIAWSK